MNEQSLFTRTYAEILSKFGDIFESGDYAFNRIRVS